MKNYDVIILGAGTVGMTAASLLAKANFKIALIEQQSEQRQFHPARVSSINSATQNVFTNLNLWQKIAAASQPFYKMEVWDQEKQHVLQFSALDVFEKNLGFIVPNQTLYEVLLAYCHQAENIDCYFATEIKHLAQEQNWQLHTTQGIFSAPLIIGADGVHSWLRHRAAFHTEIKDYQQQAVIAVVKSELARPFLAWQRFYQENILAFLPLNMAGTEWAIVWSRAKNAMPKEALLMELMQLTQGYFGELDLISTPSEYPLKRIWVKNCVKPGLVLIGDAAHAIHPLAGQGLNLGIADAVCLSQILNSQPKAIADYLLLRRYQRARSLEFMDYYYGIDFIKAAFLQQNPAFTQLRQSAIKRIDSSKTLKKLLMSMASGLQQ